MEGVFKVSVSAALPPRSLESRLRLAPRAIVVP